MYRNKVNRSLQISIYQIDYRSRRDPRISIFRKLKRIHREGRVERIATEYNNFGVSIDKIRQPIALELGDNACDYENSWGTRYVNITVFVTTLEYSVAMTFF